MGTMLQNENNICPSTLEDNLKKALTELLILFLLTQRDYYIGELTTDLHRKSDGILNIVFPYSAIYRLTQSGYIQEIGKRTAPDGRRRQYVQITDSGKAYLEQLLKIYNRFHNGVAKIIAEEGGSDHE